MSVKVPFIEMNSTGLEVQPGVFQPLVGVMAECDGLGFGDRQMQISTVKPFAELLGDACRRRLVTDSLRPTLAMMVDEDPPLASVESNFHSHYRMLRMISSTTSSTTGETFARKRDAQRS
ncbi:MAG: hypothetical protein ABL982_17820 [Vicinamibacterales bacterium]